MSISFNGPKVQIFVPYLFKTVCYTRSQGLHFMGGKSDIFTPVHIIAIKVEAHELPNHNTEKPIKQQHLERSHILKERHMI